MASKSGSAVAERLGGPFARIRELLTSLAFKRRSKMCAGSTPTFDAVVSEQSHLESCGFRHRIRRDLHFDMIPLRRLSVGF